MHYFIDGYNFLFQLYDEVDPLKEKREEVIEHLQKKLKDLNLNTTIVFDSHQTKTNNFPTRFEQACLEIIYTPSGQTADAYILEALIWNKYNHTETVVTSDKRLATQIKALGAKVQSIDHFIKWLLKKDLLNQQKETKNLQEHPEDFKRLLEAFEKRLKEQ
jgi:predicted RNA-binding protein with PIN domain